MARYSILDCTLRDGGYINSFDFGKSNIKNIIYRLSNTGIEIVECGFLRTGANDKNKTIFGSVEEISDYLSEKKYGVMYVAMIQFGAMAGEDICEYRPELIDGIRLTFHEHEIEGAFKLGKEIMSKGYKLFMQPVGTTLYDDSSLISLIEKINTLEPYAFYLVDTLGILYKKELLRQLMIIDNNLNNSISLGFHSHNNLQMSFANAQEITQFNSNRHFIIDSSILGMGRGAGNLNTELIAQYMNVNFDLKYNVSEIMNIMDKYILPLKLKFSWGYDPAYFIAATVGCHPNYSSYLLNLQTLQIRDIYSILYSMNKEKRNLFDKEYIEILYNEYMNFNVDDSKGIEKLKKIIQNNKLLILGPGATLKTQRDRIDNFIEEYQPFVISINFVAEDLHQDLIFISNKKRYSRLKESNIEDFECICTSNVLQEENEKVIVVNYMSYINDENTIVDNAGLMAINLMKFIGVKDIYLAGFDGFDENSINNYYKAEWLVKVDKNRLFDLNEAIKRRLKFLKNDLNISYVTDSIYDK